MAPDSDNPDTLPQSDQAKPLSPKLSRKRRIGFLLALALIFLIGQELVLRLCFPMSEIENFNRINYSILVAKSLETVSPLRKASYRFSSQPDGFNFTHTLNLYGFRDRDWQVEPDPSQPRIIFIGDSYVEGAGAADGETIVDGFREAMKNDQAKLEAMNLGVQGIGPPEYLQLTADAARLFRPRFVVLTLMANDFANVPPMDPNLLYGKMTQPIVNSLHQPRLRYVLWQLKTYGTVATRWHWPQFPFLAPTPDPRNRWSDEDERRRMEPHVEPEIAAAMKDGLLNPYLALSHKFEQQWYQHPSPIAPYLAILQDYLAELNCQLLVVYFPAPEQVSDAYLPYRAKYNPSPVREMMGPEYQQPARDTAQICAQLRVPFLDLTTPLRQEESAGQRRYWNYDNHPRGSCYMNVGHLIYQRFRSVLTSGP